MASKILLRRDFSYNWISNNPVLSPGEIGYELDTGRFKWGSEDILNNHWNDLKYYAITGIAEKLQTGREIALNGDVVGSTFFDGSQDITITTTINLTDFFMPWANLLAVPSPTIRLTGDVLGSAVMNELGSVVIPVSMQDTIGKYLTWSNISEKPSPRITLTGDVSGTAVMNQLGDVTINVTIDRSVILY
jgi:hypothetical protein